MNIKAILEGLGLAVVFTAIPISVYFLLGELHTFMEDAWNLDTRTGILISIASGENVTFCSIEGCGLADIHQISSDWHFSLIRMVDVFPFKMFGLSILFISSLLVLGDYAFKYLELKYGGKKYERKMGPKRRAK